MDDFRRSAPPLTLVLASLVLWVSFAWGLPADAPAAEGEADVAPKDPWAGVRISDAYDYAKCLECRKKNDVRAETCSRCGYELTQPSGEYTYPPWVFVAGKGYYREGALVEPGKSKKSVLMAGSIITGVCLTVGIVGASFSGVGGAAVAFFSALPLIFVGLPLLIYGLVTRTKPVYALESGGRFEPYERPAFALRSPDSDGVALKAEVTLLSF